MTRSDLYEIKDGRSVYNLTKIIQFYDYHGKAKFGPHFKIYPEDYEIVFRLSIWALRDQRNCQSHKMDLNKGLLLSGPIGCGKTSLMKLTNLLLLDPQRFKVYSARSLSMEFSTSGYGLILRYTRSNKSNKTIFIDDLGIELPVRYFGDPVNVIAEILLGRYELYVKKHALTHATTNLDSISIESIYGPRVRSRMREMFNLIAFDEHARDKRL